MNYVPLIGITMKSKEKKDLFTKTMQELQVQLKEAKDALFSLKLDKASYKLKNTRMIFLKRKEIARIMTVIRRKELENEKTA